MARTLRAAVLAGGFLIALAACSGGDDPAVDAGPRDATIADAAPADATVADAGEPDTGPLDAGPDPLDEAIDTLLAELEVPLAPLPALPPIDGARVALGEALFFDPILSGNKDTACASCHQAETATADGLPLALGTGASGRGADRAAGMHPDWARRHTPELWNRGRLEVLFWDGRVTATSSVPGRPVPEGVTDPLARQALHPILDPLEMLGQAGDTAVDGTPNELAGRDGLEVYAAIEARLTAVDGYRARFMAAYGDETVTMARVLDAIAAFQRTRYDVTDTPWDRYLAGDRAALSDAAKLGAIVFFGAGRCVDCHSGPLFTDEAFHNIGVPLLAPIDEGRGPLDAAAGRFTFRTPPLRNAATSPPYMHNGTLATLQDVLRHYSNPEVTAAGFDTDPLPADLAARVITDPNTLTELTSSLSDELPLAGTGATPIGLSNLRQFLLHLVDEGAATRAQQAPAEVPSGLAVGGR